MLTNGADPPRAGPGLRTVLAAVARALGTTAVVLVLYFVLPFDEDLEGSVILALVAGVAVLIVVLVLQVRAIIRAEHPRLRALEALVISVPLFLCVFSLVYLLLVSHEPGSFTQPLDRVDALYFTTTVFATVGFGDIAASSQVARLVVTAQMVGDLVLLGIGVRVFVGAAKLGQDRRAAGIPAGPVRRRSPRGRNL